MKSMTRKAFMAAAPVMSNTVDSECWPAGSFVEMINLSSPGLIEGTVDADGVLVLKNSLRGAPVLRWRKELDMPQDVIEALLMPLDGRTSGGRKVDPRQVIDQFYQAMQALDDRRRQILAALADART